MDLSTSSLRNPVIVSWSLSNVGRLLGSSSQHSIIIWYLQIEKKKIPVSCEFSRTKFIWLVDILFYAISTKFGDFCRYQYNGRQLWWWSSKRGKRMRGSSAVFIRVGDFTFWKGKWPNLKLESWQVLRKYGSVWGRAVNTSDSGSGDLEFKRRPSRYIVSLDKELYYTLPRFTQVYKWVPAKYCWEVTLRWASIPSGGK